MKTNNRKSIKAKEVLTKAQAAAPMRYQLRCIANGTEWNSNN